MSQHIFSQFDKELDEIRNQVLVMGGLVEQQLEKGVKALVEGNSELAEDVIAHDYKVNSLEVAVDEQCTQMLARRQPTASDLRLIVAVIKTITDLERIGDEAKQIASQAVSVSKQFPKKSQLRAIERMGDDARRMLRRALDAFARMDIDLSLDVVREDDIVDREYENILRQQITYMMEDPRCIQVALDVMWSARALERIGDRSCNICEYVIYKVKGKDIRHISLDQLEQELRSS